jgi:hypothetical protein
MQIHQSLQKKLLLEMEAHYIKGHFSLSSFHFGAGAGDDHGQETD